MFEFLPLVVFFPVVFWAIVRGRNESVEVLQLGIIAFVAALSYLCNVMLENSGFTNLFITGFGLIFLFLWIESYSEQKEFQ